MENTSLSKMRVKAATCSTSQAGMKAVTKSSIALLGGVSALIGLWAIACFVGGVAGSGGPLELAKNWMGAITGM